jgi:hypothetical protein
MFTPEPRSCLGRMIPLTGNSYTLPGYGFLRRGLPPLEVEGPFHG